jgi:NAD(P)H-flavin reductase
MTHIFHLARVLKNTLLAPDHHLVVLDGSGEGLAGAYKRPGQYAMVKVGEHKPLPFAFAAAPAEDATLSLFFRVQNAQTEALAQLKESESLAMSSPSGPGFPFEEAVEKRALLIGVGTGMAPLRALVQYFLGEGKRPRAIELFYGVRTQEHLAFGSDLASWRKSGVQVNVAVSQHEEESEKAWVQHLLPNPLLDPEDTSVFLCGHADMERDVRDILRERGVFDEQIHRNY